MILHIIGPVGVGKTQFIKTFLKKFHVFDVQTIYNKYGFGPSDLKNPEIFRQFKSAIENTFATYFQKSQSKEILVVESSGMNRSLNQAISKYPNITILLLRPIPERIYKERPYAETINAQFFEYYKNQMIRADYLINLEQFNDKDKIKEIIEQLEQMLK